MRDGLSSARYPWSGASLRFVPHATATLLLLFLAVLQGLCVCWAFVGLPAGVPASRSFPVDLDAYRKYSSLPGSGEGSSLVRTVACVAGYRSSQVLAKPNWHISSCPFAPWGSLLKLSPGAQLFDAGDPLARPQAEAHARLDGRLPTVATEEQAVLRKRGPLPPCHEAPTKQKGARTHIPPLPGRTSMRCSPRRQGRARWHLKHAPHAPREAQSTAQGYGETHSELAVLMCSTKYLYMHSTALSIPPLPSTVTLPPSEPARVSPGRSRRAHGDPMHCRLDHLSPILVP